MLTESTIKNAQPKEQPFILWDQKVKGFGCRVFPKGQRSFVIMYRRDGKRVLAKLARVEDLTLKDARTEAAAELLRVRQGKDDLQTRRQAVKDAPTFADLWQRFLDEYVPDRMALGRLTNKTLNDYSILVKLYLLPVLGSLKVKDITRADLERVTKRTAKYQTRGNRSLAIASRLFSLAEQWEWRPQHTNPTRGITRKRETARDRILSPTEMQRLNTALMNLEDRHPFEIKAVFVAALTGLRISEALSLQWKHVDLETSRAILPKTKTGKRILVLAGPVKGLLQQVPRLNGSPWVFPSSRPEVPATYRQTRMVFARACKQAGLDDVRLHDLRRSLATSLAGAGVNAFLLRDTLGHKTLAMSNRYVQQASAGLIETSELAASLISTALQGKKS